MLLFSTNYQFLREYTQNYHFWRSITSRTITHLWLDNYSRPLEDNLYYDVACAENKLDIPDVRRDEISRNPWLSDGFGE